MNSDQDVIAPRYPVVEPKRSAGASYHGGTNMKGWEPRLIVAGVDGSDQSIRAAAVAASLVNRERRP